MGADPVKAMPAAIRALVPAGLRGFHSRASSFQLKCWFGNRDVHYEIWLRRSLHVIELGLHFEADPLSNARLLGAFRAHHARIRRALGDEVRLEEWDRGWARVWEPVQLARLDAALRERVTARLARYIATLEPLLRDELPADLPWREDYDEVKAAR